MNSKSSSFSFEKSKEYNTSKSEFLSDLPKLNIKKSTQ
jgi:hypothetical protein